MIKIKDLKIEDYLISNFEINENEKLGIYSRNKNIQTNLLLTLAGINRSKNNCFYKDIDVYDNKEYFKNRIYIDCKQKYLQTLKINLIVEALKFKYHRNIDEEYFRDFIATLRVRGECEITSTYKYIFTNIGNTLINLGMGLALKNNLIINDPTIYLDRLNDIEYILKQFKAHQGLLILGINKLSHHKDLFDNIIFFTDYKKVEIINPELDSIYVIDKCNIIEEICMFNTNDNRLIIKEPPKEVLKRLNKQKVNIKRVNTYELEKYL